MTELYVVLRVDETLYALPAHEVLQMESYAGATRVPGAAAHVAGLTQIRGQVVPLVDLRRRFGLPPRAETPDTRIVVVSHGTRTVGLLVDAAREVMQLEPGAFRPPPESLADGSQGFVKGVALLGERMLLLLDAAKVIASEAGGLAAASTGQELHASE